MSTLLDPGQAIKKAFDESTSSLQMKSISNLISSPYDEIALTYISVGNGAGSVGTVTYKLAGNTVNTLTLTYDVNNRLIDVVKS